MVCSNCGNEIREGQHFCTNCGTPVAAKAGEPEDTNETVTTQTAAAEAETETKAETEAKAEVGAEAQEAKREAGTETGAETNNHAAAATTEVCAAYSTEKSPAAIVASIPKEYKPMSIWKFFGFEVLFSIPIVGVIASLIFSLDVSKNVNLTNVARAKFLWTVLETIMFMLAVAVMMLGMLRWTRP